MKIKKSSAITLSDVARLAGVSDITVSRVLRGSGPISGPTRERVMEAVRRTGYVQNRLAGTLASARSNLVGVILPSLSNNVFPEVMAGINAELAQSGFQTVVGVTEYEQSTEEALVRSMLAWKPAAMIVTGMDHTRETIRMLDDAGIRIIEIMQAGERPIDTAIGLSHRDAGQATARHLVQRGYRRFAYIGQDFLPDNRGMERYRGLCEGLAQAGLSPPVAHFVSAPSSIMNGRDSLAKLLDDKHSIDVVVYYNDDMAVGGVFHCMYAGIDLGSTLGIFGFNGLDVGQALPRPLSTIRSNRERIGQLAVQSFLNSRDRKGERKTIDTGFSIIEGKTA